MKCVAVVLGVVAVVFSLVLYQLLRDVRIVSMCVAVEFEQTLQCHK